ncbi:MAG TPA: hypothetical protein VHH36_08040 [Candidatus Thermoplasmatota archaeon]|nr:hypothetical protein [Candidatus Thermoplasmatota archaeon]
MKIPSVLSLLLLGALASTTTATAHDPGACVGSLCPSGALACVVGVDPRLDVCVPEPDCFAVVWLDERVGPLHVWGSGCAVHVEGHEGVVACLLSIPGPDGQEERVRNVRTGVDVVDQDPECLA